MTIYQHIDDIYQWIEIISVIECNCKSFAIRGGTNTMPDNQDTFIDTLHDHGLRLTPQRELVLQILREASEHLDAEGIWQNARQYDQDINLATIYRNLNVLSQIGLIQQSFLGEGQKRGYYELIDKPVHYHFACLRCGKVLELLSPTMAQAQQEMERHYGVRIIDAHYKFEGLCPDCMASHANDE